MISFKQQVYKTLNRRGLRFIVSAFATVSATLRTRRLCRVFYDGEWIQRFPTGTLVETRLTLLTMRQIEETLLDLWMYRYLPSEGDTVLDVGAGTGWETLLFSRRVGRSGRVVSIEAHPRVFSCLSRVCEENGLENVTLIEAAVMDHEGEVMLSDFDEYHGNRILESPFGMQVAGTTLDQVFQSLRLSRVDLLKMNIEGAERLALVGMREMIQKTRNICISCHDFVAGEGGPEEMRTKAAVIAFLEQNNFDVLVRDSDPRPMIQDYVYGTNRNLVERDGASFQDRATSDRAGPDEKSFASHYL